jgi:acetyl-CoA carboxylase biotin carboxyl carrier protein
MTTPDPPVAEDPPPPPDTVEKAGGRPVELAQVRKHAVELLAELDRPPRNLRIEAGTITVDITWPDETGVPKAGAGDQRSKDVASAETPRGGGGDYVSSPVVGVFYCAPERGADPFVSIGSVVRPGQQVGIVEAMKLMMPVEADRDGRITEVLKADGAPVEYGEPLFALAAE